MRQTGMPDAIRITVESFGARPQRGGFCAAALIALSALLAPGAGYAAETGSLVTLNPAVVALLSLDRPDIATLALTFGVLSFAVVSAALPLRTPAHLGEVEAAARDGAIASKAAIDRAYALILSEPQVLVAWGVAADAPEIIGDPALVTGADGAERVLAFDGWLEPGAAHDMEHSVD